MGYYELSVLSRVKGVCHLTTETSIYEYAKQGLSHGADRTAIWFYGRSISYGELFEKIDNVADHLYELGVREGTVVTIHLPNCPQAVMAVYAVAKLGGICNMVHALIPSDSLDELMKETKSSFLICSDQLIGPFPSIAKVVVFVSLNAFMGFPYKIGYRLKYSFSKTVKAISFESLALKRLQGVAAIYPNPTILWGKCVIYLHSSGTEGEPKTVMHSHFAINSWEADADQYYKHWDQSHRSIYCVLPFFHGFGLVTGMHHAMVNKLEQIIVPKFSPDETLRLLHKRKANIIIGTPALYEKLLAKKKFNNKYLPFLNECTVGGDRVNAELVSEFDRRLAPNSDNNYLFEGYGLSEVISAVSYNNSHFSYRQGSAGKLLPGISACVRNGSNITHTGIGEILISGNTMMLGYLNAIEQPFIEHEGQKWLPTGDYGKLDEDGFIYCYDRIKDIIIHNGYNVFPSRVESAITASPFVEEVCVTGESKQNSSTQFVVAWIVAKKDANNAEMLANLKSICEKKLAPYEWPGQFRLVGELPRNNMRKIDKRELRRGRWETL